MIHKKKYTIHYQGIVHVDAENEKEAKSLAYDAAGSAEEIVGYIVNEVVEGKCSECDGTGEVPADEDDGQGHTMRGVGTQKCICQIKDAE